MAFEKKKSSRKHWTPQEMQTLANLWRDYSPRRIREAFPDRTWNAISNKARIMKLGQRLQGLISIRAASRLSGFDEEIIYSAIKEHELQAYRVGIGQRRKWLRVDPDDVRDFIQRKLADNRESANRAAKRHGIGVHTFLRILRLGGMVPPAYGAAYRLDPANVDKLVEHYWKTLSKRAGAAWKGNKNAPAAAMKDRHTKAVASRAGSIVSLDTKPSLNSSERSSHSSVAEFTLGQVA